MKKATTKINKKVPYGRCPTCKAPRPASTDGALMVTCGKCGWIATPTENYVPPVENEKP